MKKIGLCICYSVKNYGSMLQAFATQEFIEMSGLDFEIIRYQKKKDFNFVVKSLFKLFNSNFRKEVFRILKYSTALKKNPNLFKNIKIRNKKFESFEKESFKNLSEVCSTFDELKNIGKKFNGYLVGSDQLWLPAGLSTNFYNLNFVDKKNTKISYGTSFGVSKIPFYQKKRTAEFLNRIDFLSVREQKGQEIIKKLTNKNAKLVVDPTLLFTKNEWLKLIPNEKIIEEKYIFVYFIGKNIDYRKIANELKEKTQLKIVVLRHIDEYIKFDENFGDFAPFNVGPKEFVNLIRNAEYICTDSFHGSVFSILNEKKFIVFNRFSDSSINSTNSRIDSLTNILTLQNRRFNKNLNFFEQINFPIDYKTVNQKLSELRNSSIEFLNQAFSSMNNKGK